MWDMIDLATMAGMLPSEVAEAHYGVDFSVTSRLTFDRGMLWYKRWVESKKSETIPYTPDKNAKSQKPKYGSMSEIFALYDDTWDLSKFATVAEVISEAGMADVIEAAFGDDVLF